MWITFHNPARSTSYLHFSEVIQCVSLHFSAFFIGFCNIFLHFFTMFCNIILNIKVGILLFLIPVFYAQCTPIFFVSWYCIKKAAIFMDDSSLSVFDIAINCGFVKLCCQTVKAFVLKCLRSGNGCWGMICNAFIN